jgi:hypothetical protein
METTYNKLQGAIQERALLLAKIEGLKIALVQESSPYQKGDIVEVMGYSHTGKPCRILEVSVTIDYEGCVGFLAKALVLKKDGSESAHYATWSEYNDPKLKEALDGLKAAMPPINFS